MASVKKFTDAAVLSEIRHNKRQIINDKNKDIDSALSYMNYSLTPERPISEYEYYKQRKSELYCYNRADVKTLAGWIVTAPKELEKPEDIKLFFTSTADFLMKRYGTKNTISIECHYDEGKREKIRDRWTEEIIKDETGNPMTKLVHGRPHLHFLFIPACPDLKKNHMQSEKICANDVLNKKDLQRFHTDLQKFLREHNSPGAEGIITGSTKAQGRNYTVEEMKEHYEINKELERLRKFEYEHTRNIEIENSNNQKGRW